MREGKKWSAKSSLKNSGRSWRHEAQQKFSQTQMKEEVKEQVGEVAVGLKELYTQPGKRGCWEVGRASREARVERRWRSKVFVTLQEHDRQRLGKDGPVEELEIRCRRLH